MQIQQREILLYYDGPIILTGVDQSGQLYLLSAIEVECETSYVAVPTRDDEVERLKNKQIDLRQFMIAAARDVWYNAEMLDSGCFELKRAYVLIEQTDFLPEEGFYL